MSAVRRAAPRTAKTTAGSSRTSVTPFLGKGDGGKALIGRCGWCGSDPLYVAYSITGVGFQVEYAIEQAVAGTWKPEFKPFGLAMGPQASDMVVCKATPEQKAKLDEIKKDLLSGKIKVLDA